MGQAGLLEGSPGPAERGLPCDACVFWADTPHWGCPHISGRGWRRLAFCPHCWPPHAASHQHPLSHHCSCLSSCLQPLPSLLSFLPPSLGLSRLLLWSLNHLRAVDGSWGYWMASSGTRAGAAEDGQKQGQEPFSESGPVRRPVWWRCDPGEQRP